jgi:TatD DNase family protein
MTLIDAHTHLNSDELFPSWKEHLQSFIDVWWTALLNVWVDQERNRRWLLIAQQSVAFFGDQCLVKATLWWHPSLVSYWTIRSQEHIEIFIKQLEEDLKAHSNYVVAIGECGIDAHYPGWWKEHLQLQQTLFYEQAALAVKYALPVVIHSRDAFPETIEVLQAFPDLPVYMHCWWYGVHELEQLIKTFHLLRVWFCGNTTYPKAIALRESLDFLVHHDNFLQNTCWLLLETDAPWLTVQEKRGQLNRPSYIPSLYSFVAQHLWWTIEQLTQRIEHDFTRLLNRIT